MGTGIVEDYVAALNARLRGPRGARADLITETRDSLADAVEAYEHRGLDRAEAQRRAIEEFGPIGEIARSYQAELSVAYGARTLLTLAIVLPLMHVMWELNRWFWIGAWTPHMSTPPGWYLWIAKANDTTSGVAAGVALVALLIGRYLSRGSTSTVTMGRFAGVLAVLSVLAVLLGNIAIMAATWQVDARMLLLSPPVTIASAASTLVLVWLGVLARRCMSCATIVT